MMKKQFISTIILGTSFLLSTSVMAESMPVAPLKPGMKAPLKPIVTMGCSNSEPYELAKNVSKVCVFDIDETLIFTEKNPDGTKKIVKAKGGTAAIDRCIKEGYGVALATAAYPGSKEDMETFRDSLFEEDMYPQLKKFTQCRVQTNYADVRNKEINPTYIAGTNGVYNANFPEQPTGANKGQAMDRVMRTYFGMGVGHAFLDENNPWLEKFKSTHAGKMPSDKGLSGCMVLFDDSRNNEIDISNFNDVHHTNFQFVRVQDYENKVDKKGPIGITEENVAEAIKKMNESCKP